jgi:hypothetical protein
MDWTTQGLIPGREKRFSIVQDVNTGSVAYGTSYLVGVEDC